MQPPTEKNPEGTSDHDLYNTSVQSNQRPQQTHFGRDEIHRSYFDSTLPTEPVMGSSSAPPLPEGSVIEKAGSKLTSTSPSPPHSSTTTTVTTTTPTSIGNASASGDRGGSKESAATRVFPGDAYNSSNNGRTQPPQYPHQNHRGQHQVWANPNVRYTVPVPPQGPHFHQQQSDSHYGQGANHRYDPSSYSSAIKLLVSNNVAGSIIGRGGQTISELQSQSATRIKLSQAGDFYPGTQDRVCLIQGEPDEMKVAIRLLLERLHMLQEHQHSQHMAWQLQKQKGAVVPAFDFVVRVLVPSSSCGMIIGKSGSNIKFMEETTGVASVRLSPKESNNEVAYHAGRALPQTAERVVTVTGSNMECCVQCICLILDGLVSHPDLCRYSNMTTSYSRLFQDVLYAPADRAGGAIVPPMSPRLQQPPSEQPQLWESQFSNNTLSSGIPRRIASSPDLPQGMISPSPSFQAQEQMLVQTPERLGGYSNIPAVSFSPVRVPGGGPPMYLMPQVPQPGPESVTSSEIHTPFPHSSSAPDLLAAQIEQSMHISSSSQQTTSQVGPPVPNFSPLFAPQTPALIAPGCFGVQVLVPDVMVGSILGRGGRTLSELQINSMTRIRISQRGEYMPGTRSRVVMIRGQSAESVWNAQYLMSQRMVLPPTADYPAQTTPINSNNSSSTGQVVALPGSGGSPMDPLPNAPNASGAPTKASGQAESSQTFSPSTTTALEK